MHQNIIILVKLCSKFYCNAEELVWFLHPTQHETGQFGDESFQVIDCTCTDN